MKIYDQSFNLNEWFVLGSLLFSVAVAVMLPRRFPVSVSWLLSFFCVSIGLTVDHSISVGPADLYDVNDNSGYQWMDFFVYLIYGPCGYLLVYFYDKWNIKGLWVVGYLTACSLFAVGFEWISLLVGIFHYKGYSLQFSFPIYLTVQGVVLLFYHLLLYKHRCSRRC
jgi:hypothetical protein